MYGFKPQKELVQDMNISEHRTSFVSRSPLLSSRPSTGLRFVIAILMLASAGTSQSPQPQNVDALIHAIQSRDVARAKRILNSGIDLNVAGQYGQTPLGQAIGANLPSLALEMIQRGANVNLTDIGWSPLMYAASTCQEVIALALLNRGAVVGWSDRDGGTALIVASDDCRDGNIVNVLLKAGANVNAADTSGDTALIVAARSGNERAVRELIAAGADPNRVNADGQTALSVAKDHPFHTEAHERISAMLIKAGAR
jgi:ankyrin repeat protein